jgi:hypothetical protein
LGSARRFFGDHEITHPSISQKTQHKKVKNSKKRRDTQNVFPLSLVENRRHLGANLRKLNLLEETALVCYASVCANNAKQHTKQHTKIEKLKNALLTRGFSTAT